ncbi:family 78 glycoside hydrolase catalytic domain [Planctomycetota bacterium]
MERRYLKQIVWIGVATLLLPLLWFVGCKPTDMGTRETSTEVPGVLRIDQLRCEYQNNPIAIDARQPRLSWTSIAEQRRAHNLSQSAYQILVATDPNRLTPSQADLWNSGRVATDQSLHVLYGGRALVSHQVCYWKVRVWDQESRPCAWSEIAQWRTGLLDAESWNWAQWITLGEDTRDSELTQRSFQTLTMKEPDLRDTFASPLFRTTFTASKPVKTALAYVVGLGYHELFINNQRIGDHRLDPGQTSYDVHAFYVTHDITAALQDGANAVGLWLGNGFYGQNIGFGRSLVYDAPCARAQLWIEYRDGTTATLVTGGDWRAHTSPILFDNVYAGETYDARLEQAGWAAPDFDDSAWQKAKVIKGPTERLDAQMLPPIRKVDIVKVKAIKQTALDCWIVDLGQNISGWLRLKVNEDPGTQIGITYGEHLMPDSNSVDTASTGHFATGVIQQDIYVCKEGAATWEPRFTYQGFRYAEIRGLTKAPTKDTVQGVLVHSDVAPRGSFACSDELLNKMVDVSKWTIVDNLHSIPEDCPHREKCGWTGDAHLMSEAAIFHFDMAQFLTKYMIDIEGVLGRGGVRYVSRKQSDAKVPTMVAPGKRLNLQATADWGVAIVLIPWYLHVYYGDTATLDRFYPHMKVWAQYEWTMVENGLLKHGLGDWCPPLWDRKTSPEAMECDPAISATLLYLEALRIVKGWAGQQGDSDFFIWCQDKHTQLLSAFTETYLQPVEGETALTYGSQTANALALRYGLHPEALADGLTKGLVWDIQQRHNGHHACGVFGLKHLFTALADHGQEQLAYDVLTVPTFPSHTYTLNRGMTTWPERQFPLPEGVPFGDRSYNHPFHSGFITFFHEAVAGIRPDPQQPGFKHILMKPALTNVLGWAKAEHQSPYGPIKSHWRKKEEAFQWDIEIPVNSTASVYVPGQKVVTPPGATPVDVEDGYMVFEIGSGKYTFMSK